MCGFGWDIQYSFSYALFRVGVLQVQEPKPLPHTDVEGEKKRDFNYRCNYPVVNVKMYNIKCILKIKSTLSCN